MAGLVKKLLWSSSPEKSVTPAFILEFLLWLWSSSQLCPRPPSHSPRTHRSTQVGQMKERSKSILLQMNHHGVGGCHGAGPEWELFPECPQRPGGGPQMQVRGTGSPRQETSSCPTHRLGVSVGQFGDHRVQSSQANSSATTAQIPASHQIKTHGVKVAMWGTQPQNYHAAGALGQLF